MTSTTMTGLSGLELRKSQVIMDSLILKSATLVTVAALAAGCASSPNARIASPTAPAESIPESDERVETRQVTSEAFANKLDTKTESKPKADHVSLVAFEEQQQAPLEADELQPSDFVFQPTQLQTDAGFTLDALIAMATTAHPSIAQAEAAVTQAEAVRCQVGLKPNPTVGYFGQEIGNEGTAGQHGVFASQTIVRADKLNWNRSVTAQDVNRLKWDAATQRRRLETDVRVAFYKALAAQQRLQRARQFRSNAIRAVDVARQRLDAKEGTKPDLLQSQLLVDEIDLSIQQSQLQWEAVWSELAATVGQPTLEPRELSGQFAQSEVAEMDALYQEVVSSSPQLAAARAKIERARRNLQRQRNQAVPNVNVQLGLGIDDSTNDTFANLQLGVPLNLHNSNQGNITAAQAEYSVAIQNLRRLELRLQRDMADVYRRYESAAVAIRKFETSMLPRAEESLELIEEAQRAGEIDFLRVLTARQTVFHLQQKLITARGELSQAAAEIEGDLLSNALGTEVVFESDDGLRGQALSGQ